MKTNFHLRDHSNLLQGDTCFSRFVPSFLFLIVLTKIISEIWEKQARRDKNTSSQTIGLETNHQVSQFGGENESDE